MSKLFVRKESHGSYDVACAQIWNYLLDKGYPNFEYYELFDLWCRFSEECYSAGFLTVEPELIEKFINWLEEQDA